MIHLSNAFAYDNSPWTQTNEITTETEQHKLRELDYEFSALSTPDSGLKSANEDFETEHPVWVLNIEGALASLAKPVVLRARREGEHYFAENEYLSICGYGDTRSEALYQAIGDIVHFYSHYTALRSEEVIGFGAELRDRYLNLVVR